MRTFFLLLLFIFQTNFCFSLTFGQQFSEAHAGDFVVLQIQKHVLFVRIVNTTDKTIDMEEIMAPESLLQEHSFSWNKWRHNDAPEHTSWAETTLDRQTGKVLTTKSLSDNAWVENTPVFEFLPILFQLPLKEVPTATRKRIGPPPQGDEQDRRKFWVPPVVVDGTLVKLQDPIPFRVYETVWPDDGSELAKKILYLYFPDTNTALSYFPYWVEVVGPITKVKLRVIDSGRPS